MKLAPVILAGGSGTRLWPLSREHYPKQFLSLFGDHSLLQDTVMRLDGLGDSVEIMQPLLVCNENHRFMVVDQLSVYDRQFLSIILEPEGRNTAPALTASALYLQEKFEDVIMIMMPADHRINCDEDFYQSIRTGYALAMKDYLVTFGIKPGHAETGYGYIKSGAPLTDDSPPMVFKVDGFTEKPNTETAQRYISDGSYLWNSGIFIMKASVWCSAIQQARQDIYQSCLTATREGTQDGKFFRLDETAFKNCPSDSIDYAVMEKLVSSDKFSFAVVSLASQWSDIGSWSAVWSLSEDRENRNVTRGDVILKDTRDCLVRSEDRLVVTLGCRDMVIVETADAVLVANKQQAQDVKDIVATLKTEGREERLLHRKVHRPWGSYETVDAGEKFQVKRLIVKPGKKLSLQSHNKRAEHWVVVNGTATVVRGEETFQLHKDESTYIPIGTKHRLGNESTEMLEIIEVQSGDYLGEDDIVRYDDDFGRV